MNVADLVDEVVDAMPEWDEVRSEAEKAAVAVGEWASDAGRSLRRRTDEQATWFLIGGASVIALIIGVALWRRARASAHDATEVDADEVVEDDTP